MGTRRSVGARFRWRHLGRVGRVACVACVGLGCGDLSLDLFPSPADQATADAAGADGLAVSDAARRGPGKGAGAASCLSDTDCMSREATRCEPALRVCVQCIGMGDCAHGANSICNRVTNRCVAPCMGDRDCESPAVCDRSQGGCVECLQDSQCGRPPETKCVQEACVECASTQDCPKGTRCWQATCVACVTGADCPDGGRCSTEHVCD